MKKLLTLPLLFLIGWGPSDKSERFPIKAIRDATVKVFGRSHTNKTTHGTGVYVGPNLILTAGHVALDKAETWSGRTLLVNKAKIVARDKARDIVLLKTKKTNKSYVQFSTRFNMGEEVLLMGNPVRKDYETMIGRVASIARLKDTNYYLVVIDIDRDLRGYSGGGVFTRSGKFLGMVVKQAVKENDEGEMEYVAFALPSSTLMDFLANLDKYGIIDKAQKAQERK